MNAKDLATKLRELPSCSASGELVYKKHILALADELDPLYPEPGTVVVRDGVYGLMFDKDGLVYCVEEGSGAVSGYIHGWKPARILAPDEVAIKVPPVSEWPEESTKIGWYFADGSAFVHGDIITRAEAERMEATE
jgi:hypothetical protein